MPSLSPRRFNLILLGLAVLSILSVFCASQPFSPPPPPPIQLPGPLSETPVPPNLLQPVTNGDNGTPQSTAVLESTLPQAPPSIDTPVPHIEPIQPLPLPSLTPVPIDLPPNKTAAMPDSSLSEFSLSEFSGRMDRIEAKITSIESRLEIAAVKDLPASAGSGSAALLFSLNIITFVLVLYLLWKSRGFSSPGSRREETKPLKNVKDYMRRYLSQGYTVPNMKNFLITQGYPRDLVERAAREIDAEGQRF